MLHESDSTPAGNVNQLDRDSWAHYFEEISKEPRVTALVEVSGLGSGGEPGRRVLQSISYDAQRDVLELRVGGRGAHAPALRFLIDGPRAITVREHEGTREILVADPAEGTTVIRLAPVAPSSVAAFHDGARLRPDPPPDV